MKKTKGLFWVLISLHSIACHNLPSRIKDKKNKNEMMVEVKQNITLFFYPSGCKNENCYSYKIEIEDDFLIVNGCYYSRYDHKKKKKTISSKQIIELNKLVQRLDNPYLNKVITEDVWGAKMFVNGKLIYEEGEFSFETAPEKIKQLIDYIIMLSPLEIKLYALS